MTLLTAEDIADSIAWTVTRPPYVNIDTLVILATDQADATMIHRHA